MQDPLPSLSEALQSHKDGAAPGRWTPELIASLDWLRVAELVRAIAAHAGCELAGSQVLPDGALLFGMLEQPGTAHPQRALVRVSGWNEWGATPESVERFAKEVRTAQNTRGVLIAPAGFSTSAVLVAQEHRIETVDAASLCAVLKSQPQDRSDLFFTIATTGDCTRPTCPICLHKLEQVDTHLHDQPPEVQVIAEKGLHADPVTCERLEIAAGSEVEFLYPVQARAIRVCGHATGDFSCDDTVTIEAGGTLDGRIAARSLQVLDGGELRGRFRILEGGPPEPFGPKPDRWHWACRHAGSQKACAGVRFMPHE